MHRIACNACRQSASKRDTRDAKLLSSAIVGLIPVLHRLCLAPRKQTLRHLSGITIVETCFSREKRALAVLQVPLRSGHSLPAVC